MLKLPIYLDYMASTPLDPRVLTDMQTCLASDLCLGNPASSHLYGKNAMDKIEQARNSVARLIHAAPREIIFTSGATEANNLALKGAAYARAKFGRHIITSQIEHKAVLDVCRALEKEGFSVTYLAPSVNGIIDPLQVKEALQPDTILVSLMHVNNEIGTINNIQSVAELTRSKGIWLHVDAAQSLGKLPINLMELPVDLMSFSGHKVYAPKGIGALYIRLRPRVRLFPIVQGGGQEQGLRPGTLATHQLVGLGKACELALDERAVEYKRVGDLRKKLWQGIADLPGLKPNGDFIQSVPHNLNVCFNGISKKTLLAKLNDLAISTGSACNAFNPDRSHVLRNLRLSNEDIDSSRRFSIGRFTTEQEIDYAILSIRNMYQR